MSLHRRRFLGVAVGSVVVTSAGCVGILDDSGDGGDSDGGDGEAGDGDGGNEPAEAPSVVFDFEESDDQLVITHDGGETLDSDAVTFRGPVGDWIPTGDSVTTGDRITLVFSSSAQSGDTVEIVWQDPSGDGEAVLAEHTISG